MKLLINRSTASNLTELNLQVGFFPKSGFCEFLRLCPNLKLLLANNDIGDDGLVEIGSCCHHHRKLRLEFAVNEANEFITERGLLAVAVRCKQIEKMAVYSHSITSDTLLAFGTHCRNLYDFRISIVSLAMEVEDANNIQERITLDDGVRDLLRGCEKLSFALCFNAFDNIFLSDVGLGYIGEYGTKLKWMLLNGVGDRVHDLQHLFVRRWSCPNLKKLELVNCQISATGLAEAVENLPKLKCFLLQDLVPFIQVILKDVRRMCSDWRLEYIDPVRVGGNATAHLHGYLSVAPPRTDFPDSRSVYPVVTGSEWNVEDYDEQWEGYD